MRFKRSCLVVLTLLLISVAAQADTVNISSVVQQSNTTMTFVDSAFPSGITGYIDPYVGTINGQKTQIWCVDPDHLDSGSWTANVSYPGGDLSNTYLSLFGGTSNVAATYGAMAYLITQMIATNDTLTKQEYQAAIWWLADNTLQVTSPSAITSSIYMGLANTALSQPLTSGFEILSDVNHTSPKQEYIVLTPEPAAPILLGTGLLGLAGLFRRKLSNS